mmetsp:Transcript_71316/g.231795  ORF Transcript_71316/g.231795 Transcript_71316/m.231795 type:complete len:204 (+) Transcript_71316:1858-2469(+)
MACTLEAEVWECFQHVDQPPHKGHIHLEDLRIVCVELDASTGKCPQHKLLEQRQALPIRQTFQVRNWHVVHLGRRFRRFLGRLNDLAEHLAPNHVALPLLHRRLRLWRTCWRKRGRGSVGFHQGEPDMHAQALRAAEPLTDNVIPDALPQKLLLAQVGCLLPHAFQDVVVVLKIAGAMAFKEHCPRRRGAQLVDGSAQALQAL